MNKVFVSFLVASFLQGKRKYLQLTISTFLFVISILDIKGIRNFIIGKGINPIDYLFILLFTYTVINLIYYFVVVHKLSFGVVTPTETVADNKQPIAIENYSKFSIIPTTDYLEGNNSRSPKTSPKVTIKAKQTENSLPKNTKTPDSPISQKQQPIIQQPTNTSDFTEEQRAKINRTREKQLEIDFFSKIPINNPPPNEYPNSEDMNVSDFSDEPPYQEYTGTPIEPEDIDDVHEIGVSDTKDNITIYVEEPAGELYDDPNEVFNAQKIRSGVQDF
ncbi:MAG: hypothetical protein ACYDCN_13115 [Bacteroidia bacterium]